MEYVVKDQIERYSNQRERTLEELTNLNENLPFYDKKVQNLNLQIDKCDFKIEDLVMAMERIKSMEITENSKNKKP